MDSETRSTPQYTVLRVPIESPRIDDFVAKFRATRLAAITAAPHDSFLSFEAEDEHPLSVWQARLYGGLACLVCVADVDPTLSTEDALLSGDWAGYVFVKERMSFEEYYQYPEMDLAIPDDPEVETRWHIFDLFLSPNHRGHSAGNKIIEGLLAYLKGDSLSQEPGTKRARVRIAANPKKEWLLRWYRRWGCMDRGMCTLAQGYEMNGWSASLPEDTESTEELRAKWHAPLGKAMERVLDLDSAAHATLFTSKPTKVQA